MKFLTILVISCSLVLSNYATAATYQLPKDGSDVVGEMKIVYSEKGDTLTKLGIRYEVGYNEIKKANPKITRKRLRAGTPIIIPTAHVLPAIEREGLVVNLSDMRLYYFPTPDTVVTFPVAIGKAGWSTPQGITYIKEKKRHPTWTPPPSIRREAAKRGRTLRRVYPAGPNNPLGTRALRLGMPGYLIHGTNKPWSIGQRRSHGCIRMRRDDVEALFEQVEVGMPVKIIKQPSRQLALPTIPEEELHLINNHAVATTTPKKVKKYRKKKVIGGRTSSQATIKHDIPKKYLIPADVFKVNQDKKVVTKPTKKKAESKAKKNKRELVRLEGLDLL